MSSSDRLAEIARKKEQLAEIKRRRQERARNKTQPGVLAGTDLVDSDVNTLVEQLLSESSFVPPPGTQATTGGEEQTQHQQQQHQHQQHEHQQQARPAATRMRFRSRATLGISEVRHEDILPGETITYTKGMQTDPVPELEKPEGDEEEGEDGKGEQDKGPGESTQETDKQQEERESGEEAATEDEEGAEKEEAPDVKVMDEEEAQGVINTHEFQDFFDGASLLVERVLNVEYDPLIDYAASAEKTDEEGAGDTVRLKQTFYSGKWAAGRTVTALDWNPKHQELLATAYNDNPDEPHMPDGCVLIWNLHNKDRPERAFECQSAVVSCKFAPYQPQVLVGGTYSGQIVVWDMREKKSTPHQQSNLNAAYHSHPVFCLDVVGTQNAHSLISVSTDGRLCSWNLDSVLDTQDDVIDLSSVGAAKGVAPTCMSFPANDINNLIVGSEDGSVYQVSRLAAKQDKISEPYALPDYSGPVTGLQFHPSKSSAEFSNLFVSSSTDWTVKLWSLQRKQPLMVLDYFDDYVYDVEWSPVHPALFATADGLGNLDFWNLVHDTEVPYTSISVREGKTAINKIRWNKTGNMIAAGDADGCVSVFELRERLYSPGNDASLQLRDVLADLQANRADRERTAP